MNTNIAYILLCHDEPETVAKICEALKYDNDKVFMHVDKKVKIEPFLSAIEHLDNVYIVKDRIENYWGGFNSICATMATVKEAINNGKYSRFVLIQGKDYPLFSCKKIHDFFDNNPQVEFCKGYNISVSSDPKDYMRVCGYWDMDFDSRKFTLRLLVRKVVTILNTRINVKYRKSLFVNDNGEKWNVFKGWAQFSLTNKCMSYILDVYENNQAFNNFMKHRFPPDEMYFQTIIYNSVFKENVSTNEIKFTDGSKWNDPYLNLTYFEYPDYIKEFVLKEDADAVRNTGCLFVRKVTSKSGEFIHELERLKRMDSNILNNEQEE